MINGTVKRTWHSTAVVMTDDVWLLWLIQSLLTDEQIAAAPILILGNKIDLPGAASEDEIRHLFGLHSLTTGKVTFCFLICFFL